jgi:hypothetical protein
MKRLMFVLLIAGCDDDSTHMMMSMDLSVGDLVRVDAGFLGPCQLPTRADDPLEIVATVEDVAGEPLAGVSVALYKADGTLLKQASYGDGGSATSDDGGFSLSVATGGTAFLGYFSFTTPGQPTIYVYTLFAKSQTASTVTIVNDQEVAFAYSSLGVTPVAGKGALVVQLADCMGNGLSGATASVQPAGATVGYDDGTGPVPKPGTTETSASGGAYALNTAAGPNTISFVLGAQSIVSPPLLVPADGVTLLLGLRP